MSWGVRLLSTGDNDEHQGRQHQNPRPNHRPKDDRGKTTEYSEYTAGGSENPYNRLQDARYR